MIIRCPVCRIAQGTGNLLEEPLASAVDAGAACLITMDPAESAPLLGTCVGTVAHTLFDWLRVCANLTEKQPWSRSCDWADLCT